MTKRFELSISCERLCPSEYTRLRGLSREFRPRRGSRSVGDDERGGAVVELFSAQGMIPRLRFPRNYEYVIEFNAPVASVFPCRAISW